MSGDDLTIVLFLVGTGISVAVAGVAQAGWRHRLLIRGLFAAASVFCLIGVFWPFLKGFSPKIAGLVAEVATSPVSWFCLVILSLAAQSAISLARQYRSFTTPTATTIPEIAVAPGINRDNTAELSEIRNHVTQLRGDNIHLLAFSINQTTLHLLENAVSNIPINNNLSSERNAEKRIKKMYEIETAIRNAQSDFYRTDRGSDIYNILAHSQWKAEQYVKITPVPEYLDQIDFLKCETIELQALDLKWYLMRQVTEKREQLAHQRGQLLERSRLHNKT